MDRACFSLVQYMTLFSFPCSHIAECMGYLDTLIVDVLGGEWKRLIFCGLEAQVVVEVSDRERQLELEQCNYRERLTLF